MTRPAWTKVEELFHAALERPPAERKAFLREACGGDEELRREVGSLLAQERDAERLMEEPAAGAATQKLAVTRGTRLGPYEVTGLIGAGGMGEVYRARDTRLGREVAVKVLPADFASDPERLRRFEREARAVASLNHPHILTVHDVGTHGDTPYVVTELLQGRTLREVLEHRAPALKQALAFAVQAAQGLAAAHKKSVVHRDVKPENLFVTSDGQVKVLDFGLAKQVPAAAEGEPGAMLSTASREGVVMGTVAYMSPEQAQGLPVDARSDIFSFGVVLYEMLTHKHPFRRETPTATLGAIVETEPKPAGSVAPGLPRDLEKILLRCLRKDPDRRFQSMADVELELREVATEADGPPAAPVTPARRKRRGCSARSGRAGRLALAAVVRFASSPAPPQKLVQLTSFPGEERHPAFSPDGQQLAFTWTGEAGDDPDVYVMSVAGGSPLRLTSDPSDEEFPAWSPDGRRIAFRRSNGSSAGLHVVSPLGGPTTKVADLGAVGSHGGPYPSLAWTSDGRSLVAAHRGPNGGTLLLVPVDQGQTRVLLSNDGRLVSPAVSPDGRFLAYAACSRPWVCDLFVAALGSEALAGPPRRLTPRLVGNMGLVWSRDGRSLVYSDSSESPERLWRVAVSGESPPERVEVAGSGARDPAVSRASERLAFSRSSRPWDEDIWSLERGQPARPLIAHTVTDSFPEYSPDGKRLAFTWSPPGDRYRIHVANADGSNAVALATGAAQDQGCPAWSPDGRRIAFDAAGPDRTAALFVVDSDGGAARQLTESETYDNCPAWSGDGRWLLLLEPVRAVRGLARARGGGQPTQVTTAAACGPGCRPTVGPCTTCGRSSGVPCSRDPSREGRSARWSMPSRACST
jgi:serine/threonine protein kinase/sugar lactone lactonase YvrE